MAWTIRLLVASSLAAFTISCGDDGGHRDRLDGGDAAPHTAGGGPGDAADAGVAEGSVSCGEQICRAPALCDDDDDPPRCVCPQGYEIDPDDENACIDVDECKDKADNCPSNSACVNRVGGFDCTCDGPGRSRDGEECVCADGYVEVDGECKKKNAGGCSFNADCVSGNCVAGVCCEVSCEDPGPCQLIEGTVCQDGTTCRYGKEVDGKSCDDDDACSTASVCFDGQCVVDSTKDCSDDDRCTVDSCDSKTGKCERTPLDCDDNNPCTSDSCDPELGCQYEDDDDSSCTDGDDCTVDACSGGICVSTPMDCTATGDECTEGVCVGGECEAVAANEGGACSSGLDACDVAGSCDSGSCVGDAEACGALASACEPCSSGADCQSARLCTCQTQDDIEMVLSEGRCFYASDECLAAPCDALAVCEDPTPDGVTDGDVECTCPDGYMGDGLGPGGCQDVDECAAEESPCGVGVSAGGCDGTNPPGSYTCACDDGFVAIDTDKGQACVCDLSGTYALLTETTLSWGDIGIGGAPVIEPTPEGGVKVRGWALRYNTIESDGSVLARTIPCGATTPDLCDTVFLVAHAQYQPTEVWGKAKINNHIQSATIDLRGVEPGGAYRESEIVSLMGIALDDPTGPWPPCRQCVGVDVGDTCVCPDSTRHVVRNRATWIDADDDKRLGITSVGVARGGARIDGVYPDPPVDYAEPSECPRGVEPTDVYNYSEWPGGVGLFFFRSYQWYGGTRLISSARSDEITFDDVANQCLISGRFIGPRNGRPRADARIQGCETCSPLEPDSCVRDDACDSAELDSYDAFEQSQVLEAVDFSLEPLTSIDLGPVLAMPSGPAKESALNQACAEVREAFCPEGEVCAKSP